MADKDFVVTVLDVETTGTNPAYDQVIELSVKKGLEDGSFQKTWRIKPNVVISPQAFAVHGISADDLKDCQPFSHYLALFRRVFDGSHALVGYNLEFDLNFIQAEFRRHKQEELDLRQKLLIDPYRLWVKLEPRSLADAHRRFVGRELEGAHGAAADVAGTARVLLGMQEAFKLKNSSWQEIAAYCGLTPNNWIGPTNHFQWKNSEPVFAFGKYRGRTLLDVIEREGNTYFSWLAGSDFPEHVKEIARHVLQKPGAELKSWLVSAFGPVPS